MKVRIDSEYIHEDGTAGLSRYMDGSQALLFAPDTGEPAWALSINLGGYQLRPADGCCYIKTYAEHEGLLEQLEKAGVVTEVIKEVTFGPFDTTAHLVRLNPEIREWT